MLSDIYQLVRSLTKAEKRYFQRTASMHIIGEKNSYLRLFEHLNKQKELNEQEIIQEFHEKNLYLLKRHLQKSLLKSLRAFHSSSSITIQIHSLINEIEVLFKKGLIKPSLKLIHHAKKVAAKHERHLEMLQLLEWEVKILLSPHKHEHSRKKILAAFSNEDAELERYQNYISAFRFRFNALAVHNKEIILKNEDKSQRDYFVNEIKKLSEKKLSGKSLWQFYSGAGNYFSTTGDHVQSSIFHKKAGEIFSKHSAKLNDDIRQHLLTIYMQCISSYYLKKYVRALDELNNLYDIFNSLPDFSNNKTIFELLLHSLLLESFILMDMGQYKKALPPIKRMKKEMEKKESIINISLRNDFYYQQTGYWFCMGDFKQSETWLNKLLQDENAPKENPARYRFARIMQLMILFELKEFEQLENILPAAKKFIKKKNQQYEIENTILKFISSYLREGFKNKRSEKEIFLELKKEIIKLAKNKKEATALQIFDYIKWVRSRIEDKTISEL